MKSEAHALMVMVNMPKVLDSMLDEAIMRGLGQGLEHSREQGRLESRRDDVREVLRARFNTIPAALEQRIASADDGTLRSLLRRAAVAPRVEDI